MIKMFEQYNEYSKIKGWLDSMLIENYTINENLTVDVKGDVNIANADLWEMPFKFGRVTGDFNCSHNRLITLKGCPDYVGEDFDCSYNILQTLLHTPKYIGGRYYYGINPLPALFYNFDSPSIIKKYQNEYSIWNSDETFNEERFKNLLDDYQAGLLN